TILADTSYQSTTQADISCIVKYTLQNCNVNSCDPYDHSLELKGNTSELYASRRNNIMEYS
ncbi:1832_t:CDS:1, partial [Racocetra fulgida]